MKKVSLALVVVCTISMLSSCGSSPYKKRKGCKGNGGWYGKRNLGAIYKVQEETPAKNIFSVHHSQMLNSKDI
ncbi:hypothetical protein [Aureispira anguillae]|uniref:Lipoprotein n=1 Tax=Aureispira anguillae TaxID=2864201 RepID=A0A915YJM2_9BACT|nr:hypothetical protein [Aureispira anguillae]BDS14043.1 hypothetical protein AsAng_0048060 [Aureispira anguillae]